MNAIDLASRHEGFTARAPAAESLPIEKPAMREHLLAPAKSAFRAIGQVKQDHLAVPDHGLDTCDVAPG